MAIPDRFGKGSQEWARHDENIELQKEMIKVQKELVKLAEWQKRFSFALVVATFINLFILAKSLGLF